MPSRTLHCEVLVLSRGVPRESCTPLTLLCPENGVIQAQQRRGKGAGGPALDLFDSAALTLAGEDGGHLWFVREAEVRQRRQGIALRYEALQLASKLCALLVRNQLPDDGRAAIHALAGRALDAIENHPALAEMVYLKFLYRLARDEGYAVRQQWLAELHGALRDEAETLLASPLEKLASEAWAAESALKLIPRLEAFLREHTDIRAGN